MNAINFGISWNFLEDKSRILCICLLNCGFDLAYSIIHFFKLYKKLNFLCYTSISLFTILECYRILPAAGWRYILITSLGRPWLCRCRYLWPDQAQTTWWVSYLTSIVRGEFRLPYYYFYHPLSFAFCLYLCRYFLFNVAKKIAPLVVMFLPKNVNLNQLAELSLSSDPPWSLEVRIFFLFSIFVLVNSWDA